MAETIPAERPLQASPRRDQAARAAWLYYVGGSTQDEIAARLGISRQAAQRLISLAVAEKLVRFRFDHPIGPCMEQAAALTDRYRLLFCDVVPAATGVSPIPSIAIAGAQYLERWFAQRAPLVLGLTSGRTLHAIAAELSPMDAPQHKVMSISGTIERSGRATAYEAVMRIAERVGAECFPMPTPVIATSVDERRLLQTQQSFRALQDLLRQARCLMVGIGTIGWQSQIHANQFVTDAELIELMEAGAVGEIAGWSFDAKGRVIEGATNERVAGLRLEPRPGCVTIGVAGGADKVAAIRAALEGRLVDALITDEQTAMRVLGPHAGP